MIHSSKKLILYWEKSLTKSILLSNQLFFISYISFSHCLKTKLKHRKMSPLQVYIPGFQNHPSYPKQKEFLKSTKGNLKKFNLSTQTSTWTGLDRAWDTFSAKVCNSSFFTLNKKSFCQTWNQCTGKKVPKWQFGKK